MIKPLFILFLNIDEADQEGQPRELVNQFQRFLEKKLIEYQTIVIAVLTQPTSVSVFYPTGSTVKEYNDLIGSLAKTTSFKNIRVKLNGKSN